MAVSSFTFRFTGNVAYTDNSNDEYTQAWDSRFNSLDTDTDDVFEHLLDREFATIDAFLATLLPTVFTNTDPALADQGKTVRTYVFHMSGQVAHDDNTVESFDFELAPSTSSIDGGGATTVTNHSGAAGLTALDNVATDLTATLNASLDQISKSNVQV